MARVTVEDCLSHVNNRFDLVLKAAKRAHQLELGEVDPLVTADNDKPTVIALREIAAGFDIVNARTRREMGEVTLTAVTKVVQSRAVIDVDQEEDVQS